jgi:hypothetical protein
MENQVGPMVGASQIAGSLARACESGDLYRLESAIGWGTGQLSRCHPASSLETERRELLLSIVESLDDALRGGQWKSRRERLEVCHDLLCQVGGANAGCGVLRAGVGVP